MSGLYGPPLSPRIARGATLLPNTARTLRRFRAALAHRSTTPVDILWIGDSITEGYGATLVANRFAERVTTAMRARYQPTGVTGGVGYVPSYLVAPSPTGRAVTVGAPTQSNAFGIGMRCLLLGAAGQGLTITAPMTDADILYAESPFAASFSWHVDAGAATNVVEGSGAYVGGKKVAGPRGLDGASHTLHIDWLSGSPFISGAMIYNQDLTTGIRTWEGARFGTTSADWRPDAAAPAWYADVTTIQPALIVIELGINDPANSISAAATAVNAAALAAELRNRCTVRPSIVFLLVHQPIGNTTWPPYVAALYQWAATDGDVALIDLYESLGAASVDAALSLLFDTTHPNDAGNQWYADLIAGVLLP